MATQHPEHFTEFDEREIDFQVERIRTVVGKEMVQDTSITTKYGLIVFGELRGNVTSYSGTVYISQHGIVRGSIYAQKVLIAGQVFGNIRVEGTLYLRNTARIVGDIAYQELALSSDAIVDGELRKIHQQTSPPPLEK